MAEDPDNIILVYLRRLDAKMDGVLAELHEIKSRLATHETTMVSLRHEDASLYEAFARQQAALDRLRDDMSRIERRLDLNDQSGP